MEFEDGLFYIHVLLLQFLEILDINLVKKTHLLDKTDCFKCRHVFLLDFSLHLTWTSAFIYTDFCNFLNIVFYMGLRKNELLFKYLVNGYLAFGIFDTRLEPILTKNIKDLCNRHFVSYRNSINVRQNFSFCL